MNLISPVNYTSATSAWPKLNTRGAIDSFALIVAGYPLTSLSFSVSPIGRQPAALFFRPPGRPHRLRWFWVSGRPPFAAENRLHVHPWPCAVYIGGTETINIQVSELAQLNTRPRIIIGLSWKLSFLTKGIRCIILWPPYFSRSRRLGGNVRSIRNGTTIEFKGTHRNGRLLERLKCRLVHREVSKVLITIKSLW